MGVTELRRVKQLEEENRRLEQAVADLTLDKQMLQEGSVKRVLKPARKREAVTCLAEGHGVSHRRACGLIDLGRSTLYYVSQRKDDRALRMRLRELAAALPRFGYRRLYVILRREGWQINHKRVYRLYGEEGMSVRTKKRRKRASRCLLFPQRQTNGGVWMSSPTVLMMGGAFEL